MAASACDRLTLNAQNAGGAGIVIRAAERVPGEPVSVMDLAVRVGAGDQLPVVDEVALHRVGGGAASSRPLSVSPDGHRSAAYPRSGALGTAAIAYQMLTACAGMLSISACVAIFVGCWHPPAPPLAIGAPPPDCDHWAGNRGASPRGRGIRSRTGA